jgi:hypothetical protein
MRPLPRQRWWLPWLLIGASAGCTQVMDRPTQVKDLRVLGLSVNPPEVLMRSCTPRVLQELFAAGVNDAGVTIDPSVMLRLALEASVDLDFAALVADPRGAGRPLEYELRACVRPSDRTCAGADDSVSLWTGVTTAGEVHLPLRLGAQRLPDGNALLLAALNADVYRGLGGIRVPVVLRLAAPDTGEVVYAQKLMVFQCQLFPAMKQNLPPVLPGMLVEGTAWSGDETRALRGRGPFDVDPMAFDGREEAYVVPTFSFEPLALTEAWKISRFSTMGQMTPFETGGTDFAGKSEAHHSRWEPDVALTDAQDVDFWFVVRDGRGGTSWLTRKAHWSP